MATDPPHNDVNDYTNWRAFRKNYSANLILFLDSVLWCIIRFVTAVGLFFAAIVFAIISPFVWVNQIIFSHLYFRWLYTEIKVRWYKFPIFLGNLLSPSILKSSNEGGSIKFEDQPEFPAAQLWDPPVAYNPNIALYTAHLSAVVYECDAVHNKVLESWGFHAIERIYREASTVTLLKKVVWDGKEKKVFLFIVFKGTSPLNLNEWMTDFSMERIVVSERRYGLHPQETLTLQGTIHEGFFHALIPGKQPHVDEGAIKEDAFSQASRDFKTEPLQGKRDVDFGDVGEMEFAEGLKQTPFHKILRKFDQLMAEEKLHNASLSHVRLWISGHSLGAGMANTFMHLLMSNLLEESPDSKEEAVKEEEAQEHFLNKKILLMMRRALAGVYTFGTPKTGDDTLINRTNNQLVLLRKQNKSNIPFWRVRNGNDIVAIVPFSWGTNWLWYYFDFDMQTPTLVANFHAPGKAARLSYSGSPPVHYEEEIWKDSDITITFWNYWRSWARLNIFSAETIPGGIAAATTDPFIFDHSPSEYVRHIRKNISYNIKHNIYF